jgi:hypothetical protein
MSQVIDNLTSITGRVLHRTRHPTLPDYDLLNVVVEHAEPVPGRADLLSGQLGKEIGVTVRRDLLGEAQPGSNLRCRAKRTPDGAMCEPHPEPGNFAVTT